MIPNCTKGTRMGRGTRSSIFWIVAFLAAASACNWHPISRALTWYGYIDASGKTVIPVHYSNARSFSEGLAAVQVDDRWGYIDRAGRPVIPPQFVNAREFHDGRALVEIAADDWHYIDPSGRIVPGVQVKWSIQGRRFSEGLAAVFIEDRRRFACLRSIDQEIRLEPRERAYVYPEFCGRWGYIDADGAFAIQPAFIEAYEFSEGLAVVRVQDLAVSDQRGWRYGYVDRSGALAIPARFDKAFEFSEGLARVGVQDSYGFITRDGKWLAEASFEEAGDFHEGMAAVKVAGRWGCIDRQGRMAIPAEFARISRFSEGLAVASRSGKLGGYIDTSGRLIIEERFGVAWPFADGRARVQIGASGWDWAYIDRAGKPVITRHVKQGWSFSEGLALIGNGGPF